MSEYIPFDIAKVSEITDFGMPVYGVQILELKTDKIRFDLMITGVFKGIDTYVQLIKVFYQYYKKTKNGEKLIHTHSDFLFSGAHLWGDDFILVLVKNQ